MNVRPIMKFVHGGAFAAEVTVEIIEAEGGWARYLSLEDAYKLDDVRDAYVRAMSIVPLGSRRGCTG